MKTTGLVFILFISFLACAQQNIYPDFLLTDTLVKLNRYEEPILDSIKIDIIKSIYSKEPFFSYYNSFGDKFISDRIDNHYLIDINQDNNVDYIYYGRTPSCNFQKLIIIAECINKEYQIRCLKEADFINFSINDSITTFQLINTACCGNILDVLYTYQVKINDSIILSSNADIFWHNSFNPTFPDSIKFIDSLIINKDSIFLTFSPSFLNEDHSKMVKYYSANYFCMKGQEGIIFHSIVDSDQKKWFFVRIDIDNNSKLNKKYLYGWICANDVKIKNK